MSKDLNTEDSGLDFCEIRTKPLKANQVKVYPEFIVNEESEDLMIRGSNFYAIWDKDKKRWNKNKRCVQRLVDRLVDEQYNLLKNDPQYAD